MYSISGQVEVHQPDATSWCAFCLEDSEVCGCKRLACCARPVRRQRDETLSTGCVLTPPTPVYSDDVAPLRRGQRTKGGGCAGGVRGGARPSPGAPSSAGALPVVDTRGACPWCTATCIHLRSVVEKERLARGKQEQRSSETNGSWAVTSTTSEFNPCQVSVYLSPQASPERSPLFMFEDNRRRWGNTIFAVGYHQLQSLTHSPRSALCRMRLSAVSRAASAASECCTPSAAMPAMYSFSATVSGIPAAASR
jgi:hypothetical protein